MNKKLQNVEKVFKELPNHLREVDTYRALAHVGKIPEKQVNERLGVAELLHKKTRAKRKKRGEGFEGFE